MLVFVFDKLIFGIRMHFFRYTSLSPLIRAFLIYIASYILLVAAGSASAHSLDQSYVYINLNTQPIQGRIEITIVDLNRALATRLPEDRSVTIEDIYPFRDQINEYFLERVSIRPNGGENSIRIGGSELDILGPSQYLKVFFSIDDSAGESEYYDIDYRVLFDEYPDHRAFALIEHDWGTGTYSNEAGISLVFEPGSTTGRLDASGGSVAKGSWGMVRMGMHHIWIGLDHILFLFALLLPATFIRAGSKWTPVSSFKDAFIYTLKIVTLFTVAHTITLSFATFVAVPFSSRVVESIIALSIAVAALDILYPLFHRRIWLVVFVFGLFHGFGFASVLSDLGIPPNYMAYSLLSFNIGVELGQLLIVAILLPGLYVLRNTAFYRVGLLWLGPVLLIAVAIYWFVERGFMVNLPVDENFWWALKKYGIYG
jgi:hypothetical protein